MGWEHAYQPVPGDQVVAFLNEESLNDEVAVYSPEVKELIFEPKASRMSPDSR